MYAPVSHGSRFALMFLQQRSWRKRKPRQVAEKSWTLIHAASTSTTASNPLTMLLGDEATIYSTIPGRAAYPGWRVGTYSGQTRP